MALVTRAIHTIAAGVVAQLVECHTGMHSPWVPFPALQKHDVTNHACNPTTQEVQTEDKKFSATLCYIGHPDSAWDT